MKLNAIQMNFTGSVISVQCNQELLSNWILKFGSNQNIDNIQAFLYKEIKTF